MATNSVRRGLVLALALGFFATPFLWASAQAANITVFAAASLKNALDDAAKKYEAKTGDKIVVSYAASSALAKQIEQGAPADIFFSADLDWMDYLEQKKLIDTASRHTLLGNTLVLIAPKDSTVSLTRTSHCCRLWGRTASSRWRASIRCPPGSTAKRL